jgi:hypothetical protein
VTTSTIPTAAKGKEIVLQKQKGVNAGFAVACCIWAGLTP